jgi:single-strand selective monofunctional uracil DNA glycosylase
MPDRRTDLAEPALRAIRRCRNATAGLRFSSPVTHVYRPLEYAWQAHASYFRRYGRSSKRILFLGMNPGPWGMAQTGIPFGEVAIVRDWLGITEPIERPVAEHPKRPVLGLDCPRSEVSGRRLWGLFAGRFGKPESFFAEHLVLNYCPLVFMEESGRNRTPDKLPAAEAKPLVAACDDLLREMVALYAPTWVVGVGAYAESRLRDVMADTQVRVGKILHPSPASPAANRDWAGSVVRQLVEQGIWRGGHRS